MQLSAQDYTFISTPKVQGPLRVFFHMLQHACMYSDCYYSHFMYGFEDMEKHQTTVNINHLQ